MNTSLENSVTIHKRIKYILSITKTHFLKKGYNKEINATCFKSQPMTSLALRKREETLIGGSTRPFA